MIMTAKELVAFEREIADEFNAGHIRAPVHLDGGNEQQLIDVFRDVGPNDWVLCSWRSHYKALLKGVPPEKVKAEIMEGRSIALCFPEHRFLSSAIVGGILSIATGIALSIKRRGGSEKVRCFIGDMTARGGAFHECVQYAMAHDLPIRFVVENNGLSVCTKTDDVWRMVGGDLEMIWGPSLVTQFDYTLPFPHSGAGRRVEF